MHLAPLVSEVLLATTSLHLTSNASVTAYPDSKNASTVQLCFGPVYQWTWLGYPVRRDAGFSLILSPEWWCQAQPQLLMTASLPTG
jgi:hypothetical protein